MQENRKFAHLITCNYQVPTTLIDSRERTSNILKSHFSCSLGSVITSREGISNILKNHFPPKHWARNTMDLWSWQALHWCHWWRVRDQDYLFKRYVRNVVGWLTWIIAAGSWWICKLDKALHCLHWSRFTDQDYLFKRCVTKVVGRLTRIIGSGSRL